MAEYECFPTWLIRGAQTTNIPPEDLQITQDLAASLNRWAATFDSTYNPDDPLESGFAGPTEEQEFNTWGQSLARRVATEIGARHRITYFDLLTGQEVPID